MDVTPYKEMLLRKRGEILSSGGTTPLQASMDTNTRQGDLADQATGNNEVHIQLKLKQTDAKILQAIEEALWRIDQHRAEFQAIEMLVVKADPAMAK